MCKKKRKALSASSSLILLSSNRYDGRGHLHDLSEYDSGSWNTSYQLSEEEDRIEALCDEERYLALHTDLLEEEARQGGQSASFDTGQSE